MCSNYFNLFFILALGVRPARLHHTTHCINFPNVEYRDESLKSLGFHYFPNNPTFVNWTLFQEETEGYFLRQQTHNELLPPNLWWPNGTTGLYPSGTINLYAIKYKQKWLNGWYRVEFLFAPSTFHQDMHSCMKMFALEVRDDEQRIQHIGEFVLDFPGSDVASNNCPPNDATKYTIITCGGASKSEPLVSNNIVLLRDNDKDGGGHSIYPEEAAGLKIIPELRGREILNYYIRIPQQSCNQKFGIEFQARIVYDKDCLIGHNQDSDKSKDLYRLGIAKFQMDIQKIPGASDALPVPSQAHDLDCESGKFSSGGGLPRSYMTGSTYFNHPGNVGDQSYQLSGCQGEYFAGRCKYTYFDIVQDQSKETEADPKGPRQIVNQNVASGGNIPICEHQLQVRRAHGHGLPQYGKPNWFNEKPAVFKHTQAYLKGTDKACNVSYNVDKECNVTKLLPGESALTSRRAHRRPHPKKKSSIHPRLQVKDPHDPDNKGKVKDPDSSYESHHILSLWDNLTEEQKGIYGVPFDKHGFTQLVYGMRQAHALIMSVIAFFIMPVQLFITRYYKESFMNKRILYTRVWYQIHVHGILITGTLLMSSILPIMTAKRYLGRSIVPMGICHRVLGWMGISLFGIMTVLGGFRAFEDPMRKVTIFLHYLFGMIFYLIMYGQMLIGVLIPGNGVAHVDPSNLGPDDADAVYGDPAFIHVVVWLLFELGMHTIMSIKICGFDLYMGVTKRRIYLPVLIPVIKEHSTTSASGHTMRVIILVAYICGAFLSTVTYFMLNIGLKSRNFHYKGLGPMSCTHDPETLLVLTNITDDCTK